MPGQVQRSHEENKERAFVAKRLAEQTAVSKPECNLPGAHPSFIGNALERGLKVTEEIIFHAGYTFEEEEDMVYTRYDSLSRLTLAGWLRSSHANECICLAVSYFRYYYGNVSRR